MILMMMIMMAMMMMILMMVMICGHLGASGRLFLIFASGRRGEIADSGMLDV